MDLVREVTILQNKGERNELPSKYDALILQWQHIQANNRILGEREVAILETGISRLQAVKALLMDNASPPTLTYLDEIMKDRNKEMIVIRARLRGQSDV